MALLYTLLGPIGRSILDFYYSNQTVILSIFLIWALFMTHASMGMRKLRTEAISLTLEYLGRKPSLSDQEIWEAVHSFLSKKIEQKTVLVPNRFNFWIQKATPEYLVQLLKLGPDWVNALRDGEVKRDILSLPGPNFKLKN